MHAQIESLPARRHLSATPDTSFGTNGVSLAASGIFQTLAVTDGVFVDHLINSERVIQKLNDAGQTDTAWGDDGVVRLPFDSPTAWAYDARFGRLIVGGYDGADQTSPEVTEAKILRLTADGKPDPSFGSNGVYTYSPPPATSALGNASSSADLESLTVLPHGKLLVGLRRELSTSSSSYDPDFGIHSTFFESVYESTLLKLRGNGTRQVSFGRRGMRSVASGHEYSENVDGDTTGGGGASHIKTVSPDRDGGFVVTLANTSFYKDNGATTEFRFDVENHRLTADGELDATADVEWNLVNSKDPLGEHVTTFDLWLAQPTNTGVRVVGRASRNGKVSVPRVFSLDRGLRAAARSVKLPAGATLASITPTRRGYLVAGHFNTAKDDRLYASLLNTRLRPDVRWGDGGSVVIPEGSVALDPSGRIVVTEVSRISRLVVTNAV